MRTSFLMDSSPFEPDESHALGIVTAAHGAARLKNKPCGEGSILFLCALRTAGIESHYSLATRSAWRE